METSPGIPTGLLVGSCLDRLKELPDNSVDAVITDPPYGLSNTDPKHVVEALTKWATGERDFIPEGKGFMGKAWDSFVPPPAVWDECMRVLKPGGHLLAFAGSRTFDLMTLSIRFAGFDIRDSIAWLYGSGFPKSLDVSKAIDKRGGNPELASEIATAIKTARMSRGWTASRADRHFCGGTSNWTWFEGRRGDCRPPTPETFAHIVAEWPELAGLAAKVAEAEREVIGQSAHKSGIGNAAEGHYTVGGTVAEHIDITAPATAAAQQWNGWGTALKPAFEPIVVARKPFTGSVASNVLKHGTGALNIDAARVEGGRWPTNVVMDGDTADTLDQQSGVIRSGGSPSAGTMRSQGVATGRPNRRGAPTQAKSEGGASRFFPVFRYQAKAPTSERPKVDGVAHPTVKPVELMRWLVRLVTPPNGVVLDPFLGSGTTAEAAILEGMQWIGCELTPEYLPLIAARVNRAEAKRTETLF